MTPGEYTGAARRALGMTRAEFAVMLGVNPRQVRKWEQPGASEPTTATMAAMKLALAFQVASPKSFAGFMAGRVAAAKRRKTDA